MASLKKDENLTAETQRSFFSRVIIGSFRFAFQQEDALGVEAIAVHKLERFRRMFLVILLVVFFVIQLEQWWAPVLIQ